ncbi:MAG: hypothetical protein PVF54_10990, partial [Anaerolineae bacterium]
MGICIRSATEQLDPDWVCTASVGNAGIIDSGDEFVVCFKVGTHDHPWALGPFGLDTLCWGCPVMPDPLTFGRHGATYDPLEHDGRQLAIDREA